MNLIREVISDQTVTALVSIVLIVAALPMAGWSWAVNHMAGPKVKNAKEGTRKHIWRSCAMAGASGVRTIGTAAKQKGSWQKFGGAKIGDGKTDEEHSPAAGR